MIHLLLVLVIVGFIVWVLLQVPMPQVIKNIIIGAVAIVLVIWLLQMFGIATGFPALRM